MDTVTPVGIAEVRAAAERIRPYVRETPVDECGWLSERAGVPVLVKWESQQRTGSFKLRGAIHKLLLLRERGADRVLAVSAGNHGQGVALAAKLLGMRATVVVPTSAAPTKVEAIERLGADLVPLGADYDEAEVAARRLAEERGLPFVSPYNDAEVIAGQGTVGLELCAQATFGTVLVPVGGGGLLAGVAVACRALAPAARVVGVQPVGAPAMHEALRLGRIAPVVESPTCADGLAGNLEAGSLTFPLAQALTDGVRLVPEAAIERAVAGHVRHDHQIVEGSGAVGSAALLAGLAGLDDLRDLPGPIAVIVSGRNIDVARLRRLLGD